MKLCHLTYQSLIPSIMRHGLIGMPSRHHEGQPPAVWFMQRSDADLYVHNNRFRHRHDPPGDVRQIVEVVLDGYEVLPCSTPFFDLYNVKIFAVLTRRIPPERIAVVPRGQAPSIRDQWIRLGAKVLGL